MASIRLSKRPKHPVVFGVLLVISVLMVLPFAELILSSLRSANAVHEDTWLPSVFEWSNYKQVVTLIPFGRYARNSVVLATLSRP
ncbi:hypothetical protein [Streptomyces sp. NPDC005859]|uniref:hypothetical protein n=1 Tax=Streptomyces sp. NPDC005859 TaxID=3157170 RepID=UPI0033F07B88